MSFQQSILRNLSNLPGWRTNRKILVFESDDWGIVRISSNHAREALIIKNVINSTNIFHYNLHDALESNEDLTSLYDVLSSYKDQNGNHQVFTAINVVANPVLIKSRPKNLLSIFISRLLKP